MDSPVPKAKAVMEVKSQLPFYNLPLVHSLTPHTSPRETELGPKAHSRKKTCLGFQLGLGDSKAPVSFLS